MNPGGDEMATVRELLQLDIDEDDLQLHPFGTADEVRRAINQVLESENPNPAIVDDFCLDHSDDPCALVTLATFFGDLIGGIIDPLRGTELFPGLAVHAAVASRSAAACSVLLEELGPAAFLKPLPLLKGGPLISAFALALRESIPIARTLLGNPLFVEALHLSPFEVAMLLQSSSSPSAFLELAPELISLPQLQSTDSQREHNGSTAAACALLTLYPAAFGLALQDSFNDGGAIRALTVVDAALCEWNLQCSPSLLASLAAVGPEDPRATVVRDRCVTALISSAPSSAFIAEMLGSEATAVLLLATSNCCLPLASTLLGSDLCTISPHALPTSLDWTLPAAPAPASLAVPSRAAMLELVLPTSLTVALATEARATHTSCGDLLRLAVAAGSEPLVCALVEGCNSSDIVSALSVATAAPAQHQLAPGVSPSASLIVSVVRRRQVDARAAVQAARAAAWADADVTSTATVTQATRQRNAVIGTLVRAATASSEGKLLISSALLARVAEGDLIFVQALLSSSARSSLASVICPMGRDMDKCEEFWTEVTQLVSDGSGSQALCAIGLFSILSDEAKSLIRPTFGPPLEAAFVSWSPRLTAAQVLEFVDAGVPVDSNAHLFFKFVFDLGLALDMIPLFVAITAAILKSFESKSLVDRVAWQKKAGSNWRVGPMLFNAIVLAPKDDRIVESLALFSATGWRDGKSGRTVAQLIAQRSPHRKTLPAVLSRIRALIQTPLWTRALEIE